MKLRYVANIRVSNVDKKSTASDALVKLCNYTDVYYNERILGELEFMSATATADQRTAFALKPEDVVLTKDSETAEDIGVSALVTEAVPDLVCGYHLAVVRARSSVAYGPYIRWVLASDGARQSMSMAATGVTRFGLRSDAIADLEIPIWPVADQRAIADYLDRETARIDALIAAKRQMLALAEERFQALVMQHMFGNAEHRLLPLKRLVSCLSGFAFASDGFRSEPTQACRLLRGVNVTPGRLRWDDIVYWPSQAMTARIRAYSLRAGDLVIGMDRTWIGGGARVALVRSGDLPCLLVQRVACLRARGDIDYIRHALGSTAFRDYFAPITTGVSVPHISEEQVMAFGLPERTLEQQRSIAEALNAEEQRVADLRDVLDAQGRLLRERRQALITTAVTGNFPIAAPA